MKRYVKCSTSSAITLEAIESAPYSEDLFRDRGILMPEKGAKWYYVKSKKNQCNKVYALSGSGYSTATFTNEDIFNMFKDSDKATLYW